MFIRPYSANDWDQVAAIYQAGIDTGIATFEPVPKSQEKFERESIDDMTYVAVAGSKDDEGNILGWCTLWPTSNRQCYKGVAEVSVYVAPKAKGQSVGTQLLQHMCEASEEKGFWTLQAGVLAMNEISIALHEKCGFRLVGVREKISQINGQWVDITLMERRSNRVM